MDAPSGTTTRAAALEWAGAARSTRHDLRDSMSNGHRSLRDVLDASRSDPLIAEVKLLWMLESLPGARKVDTRRTLTSMGLDEGARLGSLDDVTIDRILSAFPLVEVPT